MIVPAPVEAVQVSATELIPAVATTLVGVVGGATTLKELLVAPVIEGALATSVYPFPAALMAKSLNVDTPVNAATGIVPLSVPPPDSFQSLP